MCISSVRVVTTQAPKGEGSGQFMGTWALLCDLGSMSGPLFLGLVSHSSSLGHATSMAAVIGYVGLLWFAFLMKETLQKSAPPPAVAPELVLRQQHQEMQQGV